jgi:3-keto-L-gulonate-6-phosphate decarboxylase
MLDTILKEHSNRDIIHEISRPTLVQAALERVAIVSEFRQRLDNDQMLVADFKGYDVPYSAEGRFYYASLTNLVTMMATAPNEAIQEAIQEANTDQKRVAFDLMTCLDDDWKALNCADWKSLSATEKSIYSSDCHGKLQTDQCQRLEALC